MKCFVCKSEISKESDKFNFCKAIRDITVCKCVILKEKSVITVKKVSALLITQ